MRLTYMRQLAFEVFLGVTVMLIENAKGHVER